MKVSIDKIHHYVYAFAIADVLDNLIPLKVVAYGVVIVVLVLKEVYDMYKPNPTGFDYVDILFGILGVITQVLINYYQI